MPFFVTMVHMRPLFASFKVRVGLALGLALLGVFGASTVGEFLVALDNRYSVYPVGTDTNMYGNSVAVSIVFCALTVSLIILLLYRKFDAKAVILFIVGLFVVGGLSAQVASFVPEKWCESELTLYPCSDALPAFYQDSSSGEVIYYK